MILQFFISKHSHYKRGHEYKIGKRKGKIRLIAHECLGFKCVKHCCSSCEKRTSLVSSLQFTEAK